MIHYLISIIFINCFVCGYIYFKNNRLTSINGWHILLCCFIIPIIEEAFFRSFLVIYTEKYKYYREFNALLFGFCHSFNGIYSGFDIKIIIQVVMTSCLGFILVSLNNPLLAIVYHMIYNLAGFITCIIINYLMCDKNEYKRRDTPVYINHNKLRRSKSMNDIKKKLNLMNKRVYISRDKYDEEFLDKYDKLDNILYPPLDKYNKLDNILYQPLDKFQE